jgi:hypothetical protein
MDHRRASGACQNMDANRAGIEAHVVSTVWVGTYRCALCDESMIVYQVWAFDRPVVQASSDGAWPKGRIISNTGSVHYWAPHVYQTPRNVNVERCAAAAVCSWQVPCPPVKRHARDQP